ncbi:MAG TPA: hypothetical protein VIH90_04270 [Candidatus Saccharimonadales bacterium]
MTQNNQVGEAARLHRTVLDFGPEEVQYEDESARILAVANTSAFQRGLKWETDVSTQEVTRLFRPFLDQASDAEVIFTAENGYIERKRGLSESDKHLRVVEALAGNIRHFSLEIDLPETGRVILGLDTGVRVKSEFPRLMSVMGRAIDAGFLRPLFQDSATEAIRPYFDQIVGELPALEPTAS